jgi:hypothetical protein
VYSQHTCFSTAARGYPNKTFFCVIIARALEYQGQLELNMKGGFWSTGVVYVSDASNRSPSNQKYYCR